MRHQTREFVDQFIKSKPKQFKSALEVGSLNVNGIVSDLLGDMEYLGVDMQEGPGVNKVLNGHDLKKHFKRRKFDLVLCFDTLEHDDKFWLTVENMREVLQPGGYMLIGVPGRSCPKHDHPSDYWRFLPEAVWLFYEGFEDIKILAEESDEVYAYGRKPL